MRFHVVSLPHTNTTYEFSSCAFTEKVRKFCIMMKSLGHTVFIYAGEKNEAPCDEHICCIPEELRLKALKGEHISKASFDWSLPHWKIFNLNVINGIRQRKEPKDFICVIGGLAAKPVADAFPDLMCVEFGIGYEGCFAKFRVFESYAWMHTIYGREGNSPNAVDGRWFDAVIPGYFEVNLFPFSETKEDFYLFVGRLIERKGVQIAADACKAKGAKLIVAGVGDFKPDYGECIGEVGPEKRGELMSKATATFAPTIYIEPFGNVVVESHACGTPTLTTDWGAFTETNEHGKTGFRCRSLGEFIEGMETVKTLDPYAIRQRALDIYSLEATAIKYDKYFNHLNKLWGKGWFE